MSKIIQVTINVEVNTDISSVDDIIEHLDFTPDEKDEVVEVIKSEVVDFR
jgi:hypothetical protein